MKFCMFTTFFGAHSFGGDAAFVDRLSRALARRGHETHVIYCRDAFEISKGNQTPRPYVAPPGVTIHPLKSAAGALSPLATHATGRPWFKHGAIKRLLEQIQPDVVHFHNISLIGGPGLMAIDAPGAIKLMTAHEHWLVCPTHVLWKFDREVCETRNCVRCCLSANRPPQLWRNTNLMDRSLAELDALVCPSLSTRDEHARRGIRIPIEHIPYFLPNDYTGMPTAPTPKAERPYFAAVGRLEKIKGFQDAIDAMRSVPEADLVIAGAGSHEAELRERARGLDNVRFVGRLDSAHVAALYRGARGVIVPSLVYETFGYVVLEAFAERTPVIVRNLGALPELVARSQGGVVFQTTDELAHSIRNLAADPEFARKLGENGAAARRTVWSEEYHIDLYFQLINRRRLEKGLPIERPGAPVARSAAAAAQLAPQTATGSAGETREEAA